MRIILSFLTFSFCLSCALGSHMSGAESEPDRRTEQAGSTLSFIGATSRDMMLAPPSGFSPSGERIVGTDNNLGLVAGQVDGCCSWTARSTMVPRARCFGSRMSFGLAGTSVTHLGGSSRFAIA